MLLISLYLIEMYDFRSNVGFSLKVRCPRCVCQHVLRVRHTETHTETVATVMLAIACIAAKNKPFNGIHQVGASVYPLGPH